MNNQLSVGIVTRTKNRGVLLRRALESITKQTFNNWKLIVVNDGGEPEIVDKLVSKYQHLSGKIEVIHNKVSVGMEAASNIGLKRLNTDYAVIHDDDDSWSPVFLERSIAVMEKEKEIFPSIQGIVAYTNRVIETVRGNSIVISHTEPFYDWMKPGLIPLDQMLFQNMFPPIAFVFSLDACKKLGYYNEELPVLGDWDFHIRFLLHHDIWVLPEPMAFYHHRHEATGALGNTVIAGFDKHMTYRNVLVNKWLRDDLKGEGSGLGIYINNRTHIEHLDGSIQRIKEDTITLMDTSYRLEKNTWDTILQLKELMDTSYKVEFNTIRIISFIDKLKAKLQKPFQKIGVWK